MSGKLVLVTGVTGFIAGQVADALLNAGYRVRGTTRGAKLAQLKAKHTVPGLEYVQIDDVATSNFSEALKGVDILMHVASPLAGKASVDDTLNTAIDGTLNVLKQAAAAGITKMVVTSSFGSVFSPTLEPGYTGQTFSEKSWGEVTREEVHKHAENPLFVYFASKILAERAAWDFAKANPHVDLATVLPGFVFGPFSPNYPLPSAETLGTNGLIYALMTGGQPPVLPPFYVDVRDVAKGHVLALNQPPKPVGEKRFIVSGSNYTWKQVAARIAAVHPEIPVTPQASLADLPGPASTLDTTRAREVLGIKEFISPEKTTDDAVNALLECKKVWAA